MTTFAERTRQNIQSSQGPSGGLTERILQQRAATGTGKAVGGPIGQVNMAERAAVGGAQSQMASVQANAQQQADQLAATRQAEALRQEEIAASRRINEKKLQLQAVDQVDQSLHELSMSDKDINSRDYGLKLDNAAAEYMLQDKKYVHKLQDIGRRQRLDTQSNFDKKAAELAIGSAQEQWMSEKNWKISEADKRRDFNEAYQIEDIADAESYMQAVIADETQAGMIKSGIEGATAGYDYYSSNQAQDKKAQHYYSKDYDQLSSQEQADLDFKYG